jgi:prepilin-type N-terminal cleavage/methylation domain-containing protein
MDTGCWILDTGCRMTNSMEHKTRIEYRVLSIEKGFTLIELLVVIIIIGILAGMAVPRYIIAKQAADYASVQAMVGALNAAALLQFAQNRIFEEIRYAKPDPVVLPSDLAAFLDPPYTPADYPRWSVDDNGSRFIYTNGCNTWSCEFRPERETSKAYVKTPPY